MKIEIFHNARIIPAAGRPMEEAMAVAEGTIVALGGLEAVRAQTAGRGKESKNGDINGEIKETDLGGGIVIPGIIDAHTHLLALGQSLRYLDLSECRSLEDIQRLLSAFLSQPSETADSQVESSRIIGLGWSLSALEGRLPTAAMIDAVSPDVPVYLIALDFHSAWLNSAALAEIGITSMTPDPAGGTIVRDAVGQATGLFTENAFLVLIRAKLAEFESQETRTADLRAAFSAYLSAGVTSAADLLLNEDDLHALDTVYSQDGRLPMRVRGYWFIKPQSDHRAHDDQLRRAAEIASRGTAWNSVIGVKFIVDGVIDSCTAAMRDPFSDGTHPVPIWTEEFLTPAVIEADRLGLAVALHAIGDEASGIALNALEAAARKHGSMSGRRHRLEHLEVVTPQNVERLARLGVIASLQPVHADPAIQERWRAALGDQRIERGYPLAEFEAAGARIAVSTDAPTASYLPFGNLYTATTRKSVREPGLPPNVPSMATGPVQALRYATEGAAYACGWEGELGRLEPGYAADFVVVDRDPVTSAPEQLRDVRVLRTVVAGETAYQGRCFTAGMPGLDTGQDSGCS